jgi:molecular chaperone GrpE
MAAPEEHKMVTGPEEVKMLYDDEKKVESEGKEITELKDRYMRLQAEFENYKKRAMRENDMIREKANMDAMLKLLSVVDEFDVAMSHIDKASHKDFKHGIELIYAKLLDMMKKDGVQEMRGTGETFDPFKHDAIRQADGEDGKIIEVVQKGYYINGKILRHAKVVVGKKEAKKE